MGEDPRHVILTQQVYRWIRRPIGEVAEILSSHALKLIVRMKGRQLHVIGQVRVLQQLLKPIEKVEVILKRFHTLGEHEQACGNIMFVGRKQALQFIQKELAQFRIRGGVTDGIMNLVSGDNAQGKRAEVEPHDHLIKPKTGGFDHVLMGFG